MIQKYIKIKDIEIPINIKNYKNSKSIKMYFKANVLNITKPTRLSDKRMMGILKLEEDELYNKYKNRKRYRCNEVVIFVFQKKSWSHFTLTWVWNHDILRTV